MFKPVDQKKSLPQIEHEQLEHWKKHNIFSQSVDKRKDNEKFVFFDGPPFANGLPHYGHILANALKDAVTRYWTMKGYYVPRVNGWDCHGLPVEYEIEKELEISGHKEIIKMGVDKFNEKCRSSVFKYTEQWEGLLERIGRWVDFENGYATLENRYMESIWWVFRQIWDKKLVYKGFKSMHICPRCETPLSNFEVSQGYKDVTDYSVTAKFKLQEENTYILAWTTTPWTLPGNQGLAFGPKIKYVKVKHEDENLILAEDRLEAVFGENQPKVIEKVDPKKMEGKKYEPLFPYYNDLVGKNFTIMLADFVTTENGTGIVHIAGGFGEDDYSLAKEYELEPITHIHTDGHFKEEVTDFAGKFVKGQDQNIAEHLEEKGLLFSGENYRHSYPHCWRCDTPLLNYSLSAWFIEVTKLKNDLIKNNQKINWQPDHIKDGRFGKWLENVKDWNVSRNRFWGAPLPIWESESGDQICVSSTRELRQLSTNGNNLYFVRHGQAEHNTLGILSDQPQDKRNLSDDGKKQAEKLAEKLAKEDIDVIYCSPFHRTQETANIISKKVNADIITDERLREHSCGELNGEPFEVQINEILESENIYHHKPGVYGESLRDTEERIMEFVDFLSSKHENENILIVTHGAPLAMAIKHYEEKEVNEELLRECAYISHEDFFRFYSGKVPTNNEKLDLHKPYIDDIVLKNPKTGEEYKRVEEVFDCWFESGSMPYAQLHYPFEYKKEFEANFPANFIAEGLDQTRGWFYTLHVLSTILFNEAAFKNVIVNGILLAANGEKLSKRKKNYPDPSELFESKGVDSTRLFLYQSTLPLAEDVRFSDDHVDEVVKKFTLTLWNTYSFFITYGNIDKFDPNNYEDELDPSKLHELDRWILSELHKLIGEVTANMDEYNLTKATRPLIDFVDNLSNWYIRRSRRRFWKSENDEEKMLAYRTLHTVLVELSKLIAPFTPFIADEIFRNLTGLTSVHLQDWPTQNENYIDSKLNEKMHIIRNVVSLGHAIRGKENIKVRQPLSKVKIAVADNKTAKLIKELADVVLEEINVKTLEIIDNPEDEVTTLLKPDAQTLGPKLGSKMKEVIKASREGDYEIKNNSVIIAEETLNLEDFEIMYQAKEGFSAGSNEGLVVILDTNITKELKEEAQARDIVRQVQEFRKELNYEVSDRIYLYLDTEDKDLESAITNHADYIRSETLANELQQSGEFDWDSEKLVDIDKTNLTIAIRKADD